MLTAPTHFAQLPSGRIAYRHAGSGFPLILIHGWRGASAHWQNTMDALQDIRHLYALDLPGHGETPPTQEQISIEQLARLTVELADTLGCEQFDLAGHSFGAAVAAAVAAHWPDRVRRMALTSMGIPTNELEQAVMAQAHASMNMALPWWRPWLSMARPWPGAWQPWIDWLSTDRALNKTIAQPFFQEMPAEEAMLEEGVREFLSADPLSALEIAICAGSPTFVEVLDKIGCPVLVLTGQRDVIMPASAVEALAERLTNCQFELLDGCGHMPMIEQPDRFHRTLQQFLTLGDAPKN